MIFISKILPFEVLSSIMPCSKVNPSALSSLHAATLFSSARCVWWAGDGVRVESGEKGREWLNGMAGLLRGRDNKGAQEDPEAGRRWRVEVDVGGRERSVEGGRWMDVEERQLTFA